MGIPIPCVGIEFKSPAYRKKSREAVRHLRQAIEYSNTVWDKYGRLPIVLFPGISDALQAALGAFDMGTMDLHWSRRGLDLYFSGVPLLRCSERTRNKRVMPGSPHKDATVKKLHYTLPIPRSDINTVRPGSVIPEAIESSLPWDTGDTVWHPKYKYGIITKRIVSDRFVVSYGMFGKHTQFTSELIRTQLGEEAVMPRRERKRLA